VVDDAKPAVDGRSAQEIAGQVSTFYTHMDEANVPADRHARCVCSARRMQSDFFEKSVPPALPPAADDWDARAAWLRKELNRHSHAYYVLDKPTIPDASTTRCFANCRRSRPSIPS